MYKSYIKYVYTYDYILYIWLYFALDGLLYNITTDDKNLYIRLRLMGICRRSQSVLYKLISLLTDVQFTWSRVRGPSNQMKQNPAHPGSDKVK